MLNIRLKRALSTMAPNHRSARDAAENLRQNLSKRGGEYAGDLEFSRFVGFECNGWVSGVGAVGFQDDSIMPSVVAIPRLDAVVDLDRVTPRLLDGFAPDEHDPASPGTAHVASEQAPGSMGDAPVHGMSHYPPEKEARPVRERIRESNSMPVFFHCSTLKSTAATLRSTTGTASLKGRTSSSSRMGKGRPS